MRPQQGGVRGKSNSKKIPESKLLEQDTKNMEDKLKDLKRLMMSEKEKRDTEMRESGSRWKAADKNKPIQNYADKIIED